MSGVWGHLVGVWIVVLMLVFLGIWYWAWRPRHKDTFEALARVPMLEDPPALEPSENRAALEAGEENVPHPARERTL
jgi:cytochrome c oxidase cbb3-type subunit 4